jgi:hypothetical protein
LAKAVESPGADPQSNCASLTPPITVPPAGPLVDEHPSKEHRRTQERGYLGDVG